MIYKIHFLSLFLLLAQGYLIHSISQEVILENELPVILNYNVNVGFIHVGEGKITIGKKTNYCDYAFDGEVWTTGLVKIISKIYYHFRSCIDEKTGWPTEAMRYELNGKDETFEFVDFDHFSRQDSTVFYGFKNDTVVLTKGVYDLMSGFLHLWRDFPPEYLKQGQVIAIKSYWEDEIYIMRTVYAGKETIKTKYGDVRCHKFLPVTDIGKYFKTNNDAIIWISDNEDYLPLRIMINLRIGTLTGDLIY